MLFLGAGMKFKEKIGLFVFYAILLVSISTIIFGFVSLDKIIIGIGVALGICALLLKLEFKLEIAFWKDYSKWVALINHKTDIIYYLS